MEVEAEAESKATGEADVKAGLQRGGNEVVFFVLIETIPCPPHPHYSLIQDSDAVQLDVTIKEKDAAKMRQLHAESKSQDKYGLFSADAWIKKGGAKKKKKSEKKRIRRLRMTSPIQQIKQEKNVKRGGAKKWEKKGKE